MKKRIGIFLECIPTAGGVYQYSLSVLRALTAIQKTSTNYEMMIITYHSQWIEIGKELGIKGILVNKEKKQYLSWKIWKRISFQSRWMYKIYQKINDNFYQLGKTLKKEKLDMCIHTVWGVENFMFSIPSLAPIHDIMHRYASRFSEVQGGNGRDLLFTNMVRYCGGVLVDSQLGKQQVEESYLSGKAAENVYVLPFVPPYYIYEEERLFSQDEEYICQEIPAKYFFYPAQFWEHKNHSLLLQAMVQLKEKYPDLYFVFCGSKKNGYEHIVKQIAEKQLENHVKIIGYVSNEMIKWLYKNAVGMVMPTYFGPTNIPPLEAIAMGCPVAVSRVWGHEEQLGKAALYFEPDSVQELCTCLETLWADKQARAELISSGKEKTKSWGEEQFAAELKEIIKKVLSYKAEKRKS